MGKGFSCHRPVFTGAYPAALILTCRQRAGTFVSAPRSRARSCSGKTAQKASRTHNPSQMRMTRSAPSSRSCHECDEGAERATVMAASPSSRAGMVRLASFERCQEKPCVGKFHYEKVGSTVSPGPGRFLCTQLRIAVSAHAHRCHHSKRDITHAGCFHVLRRSFLLDRLA